MPHLNDLHSRYAASGLQVVAANHEEDDTTINNFVNLYGPAYPVVSVPDATGYNFSIYSTCYAIDDTGTIIWIGGSAAVTDELVEGWLGIAPGGGAKDDESCSTGAQALSSPRLSAIIAVVAAAFVLRRRSNVRHIFRCTRRLPL